MSNKFWCFAQSLAAQHAFQIKNAPHGVEEDGSWFFLSPCRVFRSLRWASVEFPKARNDASRCVFVFQSPSWGTAAPPPPIACTPSCTSTPAPSRSPRSAGPTASSVAPWAPSWQCHATAVAWVRLAHSHTHTHGRKWVVGEQMASRNKQETCHGPDTSILHSSCTHRQLLPSPSAGLFLPEWQLDGGFSQTWRCFLCELIHHTGSVAVSPILGLEGKTMLWWFRAAADFQLAVREQLREWWDDSGNTMKQRNKVLWVSNSSSLKAFRIESGGMRTQLY